MAKFIKCSCENTKYRGYNFHNNPINIDLVTQVEKMKVTFYSDTKGTPAIMFHGIDVKWIYSENQEKQRDTDYNKIIELK